MYRDRHEQCPRCNVPLVSAGSVRACAQCAGHWVAADVLKEMMAAMLAEPRPITVRLEKDEHPKLPCPSCEVAMETWSLHGVPIDRCGNHGLWFDRAELETVLYAASGQPAAYRDEVVDREAMVLVEILKTDPNRRR